MNLFQKFIPKSPFQKSIPKIPSKNPTNSIFLLAKAVTLCDRNG